MSHSVGSQLSPIYQQEGNVPAKTSCHPGSSVSCQNSGMCLPSVFRQIWPASVAQMDVHPTGDQEVTGLIPTGSGNILS